MAKPGWPNSGAATIDNGVEQRDDVGAGDGGDRAPAPYRQDLRLDLALGFLPGPVVGLGVALDEPSGDDLDGLRRDLDCLLLGLARILAIGDRGRAALALARASASVNSEASPIVRLTCLPWMRAISR